MDDHHQYYYALTYCLEVLAYDDLKPSQLTRHKNKQRGQTDRHREKEKERRRERRRDFY